MNAKYATKICITGIETAWETTEMRMYHIEEGRKVEIEGRLAETQEIPEAEDLTAETEDRTAQITERRDHPVGTEETEVTLETIWLEEIGT
jgi:hypothetical protein